MSSISKCPPFSDPHTQIAPWHSRSAYVPPCSYSPLLARRVTELRRDYVEFDRLLREEQQEKETATKQKRKPLPSFSQRVNQFDWPAHARVAGEVRTEVAERQQRRRQVLRELLRVARETRFQQAMQELHDAAEFAAAFEFSPSSNQ